jgi:hypothetical protein
MTALLGKKEPLHAVLGILFRIPDQLIGGEGQILRILITPHIPCLFGRKFMPLLARNLATPTRRAPREVYKECFRH